MTSAVETKAISLVTSQENTESRHQNSAFEMSSSVELSVDFAKTLSIAPSK